MRTLVTGGAGFIGSNLVDSLIVRGDQVTVIDDFSTGRQANLEAALGTGSGITVHHLDVSDAPAVMTIFESARPEVVFHLAARIDVRRSVSDPAGDAKVNVLGTIAVLEAARACGCRRVVNVSSGGALYGEAEDLPTPEHYPVRPLAPYGQGKSAAEGYCELYTRLHGLSTISLRPGNVYGPRQDAEGEGGVVAIFCGHLMAGRMPTVYGDGRQTRDWVEVSDVVRANLLAAGSELTGPVNIGHGQETSVLQLLDALRDVSDRPMPEPQFAPERPGEVRRSCVDVSHAGRELGWVPEIDLRDGLRTILARL